jgi:hypothetical protein
VGELNANRVRNWQKARPVLQGKLREHEALRQGIRLDFDVGRCPNQD